MPNPTRFFITHSWNDITFAKKLCDDLHASGLDGFLDERSIRPGESIPSRIERGLEDCDVYIPILSPAALASPWCDWEIDIAITLSRDATRNERPRIMPVIAEKCRVPSRLRHLLYVDFGNWRDEQIYHHALNVVLVNGFGVRAKPMPPVYAPSPYSVPAQTPSLPNWLVPVGVVGVGVMLLCILIALGVNSFLNSPTPTPTQVSARAPTVPAPSPLPQPTATPRVTATPRDGDTRAFLPDNAPMMFVSAGDFKMGSDDADKDAASDEKPQHTVYLDAFWMDKFEVTNALYKKCVDAGKCSRPSDTKSYTRSSYFGNAQFDNYPVIYVNWDQAKTYCEWAGKRLPTEAEWEKAARGTDGRIYPWVGAFDGTRLNFCDKNCEFSWKDNNYDDGYADTSPVGNYSRGAGPYGIMDLAGNVWEWVADWYDEKYYATSPRNNPTGPSSGSSRGLRGGSWYNGQQDTRTAYRLRYGITYSGYDAGFRCARGHYLAFASVDGRRSVLLWRVMNRDGTASVGYNVLGLWIWAKLSNISIPKSHPLEICTSHFTARGGMANANSRRSRRSN
ncbi:MAG: SUMF1/EgtB/PvdO family nonheme iron enzyme [Chloroflexi bacterium]|nr:SUMF1/EgtB/PvdO family nonheme iron enzyme [Chloroflexota bacterium]